MLIRKITDKSFVVYALNGRRCKYTTHCKKFLIVEIN